MTCSESKLFTMRKIIFCHIIKQRQLISLKSDNSFLNKLSLCSWWYTQIVLSLQLCLTLWNPMHYSPPGSPVHGFLQVRILEWVAMTSFRGSSWPWNEFMSACISCTAGRFFTYSATWAAHTQTGQIKILIHIEKNVPIVEIN